MKKLKIKILIGLLLTTTLAIKAQPILGCKSPTFTTTFINSNCNSCNTLDDYIPINSDSILYVRLNFHYLMINPTTPGKFKNATIFDAQATVWGLNTGIFDSLYSAQLRYYPTPAYIKRPKIKFVFNSFTKNYDSLAYFSTGIGNWPPISSIHSRSKCN